MDIYKLKKISFHDWRHSSASLLISQGIDMKVVQERLGHTNIKTTLNIYGHLTQRDDELASDVFLVISSIGHTLSTRQVEILRKVSERKKRTTSKVDLTWFFKMEHTGFEPVTFTLPA